MSLSYLRNVRYASLFFSSPSALFKWGAVLCMLATCLFSVPCAWAACGDRLEEAQQTAGFALYGLRTVREAVREAESQTRGREAVLQELRIHPPEEYDQELARQVGKVRRYTVRPKRALLTQLREQHDAAKLQWEWGIRLVHEQFLEAKEAYQENMLTQEAYCHARKVYVQALYMYRDGLEHYKTGLALYADGLNAYREQFVVPCIRGYTNPSLWHALIARFEQEGFLQEFLNPLTANAIRSVPPDIPPDIDQLVRQRP